MELMRTRTVLVDKEGFEHPARVNDRGGIDLVNMSNRTIQAGELFHIKTFSEPVDVAIPDAKLSPGVESLIYKGSLQSFPV